MSTIIVVILADVVNVNLNQVPTDIQTLRARGAFDAQLFTNDREKLPPPSVMMF